MAIKDKDGKIYKLRGPKPLMESQSQWNYRKVRVINMNFDKDTIKDKNNPKKSFLEKFNVIDIGEELGLTENDAENVSAIDFIDEIQALPKDEPEPVPEPEPEPVPEPEPEPVPEPEPEPVPEPVSPKIFYADDKLRRIINQNKVDIWCVPAIWRETKDDVYGEIRKTKSYGKKFQFVGIIVNETDFVLQFWSTREIGIDSIVYPKNTSTRWWRINNIDEKSDGYLMSALTSDVDPDFS